MSTLRNSPRWLAASISTKDAPHSHTPLNVTEIFGNRELDGFCLGVQATLLSQWRLTKFLLNDPPPNSTVCVVCFSIRAAIDLPIGAVVSLIICSVEAKSGER